MNIKCMFGFHDWEDLPLLREDSYLQLRTVRTARIGQFILNRVCLRCGKVADNLDKLKREEKRKENERIARAKLAREIYNKRKNNEL